MIVRIAASVAVVLLVSCGGGGGADRSSSGEPGEGLQVDAAIGVGGHWEPERPTVLTVFLERSPEDLAGEIVVRGIDSAYDVTFRRPFELPREARRRFEVPVHGRDWDAARVDIVAGDESRSYRFDLPVPTVLAEGRRRYRILQIGDAPPSIRSLTEAIPRLAGSLPAVDADGFDDFAIGPVDWLAESAEIDVDVDVEARFVSPVDLPESVIAYAPVDLILLHESALVSARAEAIAALATWVERGGTLIAFAGAEWSVARGPGLDALLGIAGVDAGAAMPPLLGERLGGAAPNGIFRELRPGPGATVVLDGLAISHRHGCGQAISIAWTPGGSLPPRDEATPLHAVLDSGVGRSLTGASPKRAWADDLVPPITWQLVERTGFRRTSAGSFFLAVIVYLLVGFLVPWAIFRRPDRRKWVYVWILGASMLGSWVAYRYGVFSSVQSRRIDAVSIVRLGRGGRPAAVTSIVGLSSPRFFDVTAAAPSAIGDSLMLPLEAAEDPWGWRRHQAPDTLRGTIRVGARRDALMDEFTLFPNAPRFVRVEYATDVAETISVTEQPDGSLRVENRGNERLTVSWERPTQTHEGPLIDPGESVELAVPVDENHWTRRASRSDDSFPYNYGRTDAIGDEIMRRLGDGPDGALGGGRPIVTPTTFLVLASEGALLPASFDGLGFEKGSGETYWVWEIPAAVRSE